MNQSFSGLLAPALLPLSPGAVRFLLLLAAVSTAVFPTPGWSQQPLPPTQGESAPVNAVVSPPTGNQLVAASARELDQATAIAARIRQTGEVLGHPLEGQGTYLQADQSGEKLLRLEMQLSVGKNRSSLLQVCNLDSLCLRREVGGKVTLTRVLLSEVRDAERAAEQAGKKPDLALLTRGGLPQLMHSLAENFDFDAPETSAISSLPVWTVEGRWKKASLARLLPDQAEAINHGQPPRYEEFPPQLPARVSLVLGQQGGGRLFPFRITYYRDAEPTLNEKPLVKIEFFEVRRNAQIDPAYFTYNPDDPQVVDVTEAYLKKKGLAAP
ncbi:hypothetical protein [Lignipirellula cremea]|uniref:DUF1571 domain-containing protein n=1 Tax=Lignipirellula cremea TaxID=2528010 RepID=A0A518E2Y7_9BACT|nr:hypothetical protein [Lignipirellula cremea]QDU98447.1 hypothetical protein Pla8534_63150 [Lignipirellula cremea]